MRIEMKWAGVDWATVWKNLCMVPINETAKMKWHKTIHDIVPTNERLHKIKIQSTPLIIITDNVINRLLLSKSVVPKHSI
jgi:hypothetical protein